MEDYIKISAYHKFYSVPYWRILFEKEPLFWDKASNGENTQVIHKRGHFIRPQWIIFYWFRPFLTVLVQKWPRSIKYNTRDTIWIFPVKNVQKTIFFCFIACTTIFAKIHIMLQDFSKWKKTTQQSLNNKFLIWYILMTSYSISEPLKKYLRGRPHMISDDWVGR